MSTQTIDLRDVPPPERHPKIFDAFDSLASGEALELINDHDPRPLYYEMAAEIDAFDADGYSVEQEDEHKFVATLPKK